MLAGAQHLVADTARLAREVHRKVHIIIGRGAFRAHHDTGIVEDTSVHVAYAGQCFSRVHAHHDTPNNSDNM